MGTRHWFDGVLCDEDTQCDRDARQRHDDRVAIGSGIGLALAGSALTAFGITRAIQIRRARRELLRLDRAGLGIAPESVALSLQFRF